jgi:hypothetical protein
MQVNITAKSSTRVVLGTDSDSVQLECWTIGTAFKSIRVEYKSGYGNSCHILSHWSVECKVNITAKISTRVVLGIDSNSIQLECQSIGTEFKSIRVEYRSRYGNSCHIRPVPLGPLNAKSINTSCIRDRFQFNTT